MESNNLDIFSKRLGISVNMPRILSINIQLLKIPYDFPGGSDSKASAYNVGDLGSIPGSGRSIPWRRKWQPAPVFLPGKPHGQRRLAGYSLCACRRVRYNLATKQTSHILDAIALTLLCFNHVRQSSKLLWSYIIAD